MLHNINVKIPVNKNRHKNFGHKNARHGRQSVTGTIATRGHNDRAKGKPGNSNWKNVSPQFCAFTAHDSITAEFRPLLFLATF